MAWLTMLQQAIDYMESHLLETISYKEVAAAVNMSEYNFHRTFSCMAGMTANEYIRYRRLSLAGQELRNEQSKVIDVALKYGYDSPESFTKAFTHFHGVAPKYAKLLKTQLCLFNPLVITISMKGGTAMKYRIEQLPKQKFIALTRAFFSEKINEKDNHDIPDFWSECHRNDLVTPLRNLRPEGKRDLYGLCSPTKEDNQTFDYSIGVRVDEDTTPFDEGFMAEHGYKIISIPECTFVVFRCMGSDGNCISAMWETFFKEFLPQMGYEAADVADYEIYYEKEEPGLFCELWVPIQKK